MAQDTVQEVKRKLSIQDVVAPFMKLRKAGRSLVGLCPFHKEKTGSFHVSLERGSYHCFGCGEGGDAFSFIQKVEGVDFKGALKILAEKAGVPLEYESFARGKEVREKVDRLREAMARAVEFYVARLEASSALGYATGRGLTPETIQSWQLGYAPDDWRMVLEHLRKAGFSTEEMLAAGLIKEADGKQGTYYDRFRNRLMFPIRDTAGRMVAFTGRILPGEPSAGVEPAKYLNSPETELYHKSEVLFGLDRAKDAIRTRGFALLVEGQMDLLHTHQAGFENTVALSGTAFTADHARLLKRFSDNLMLCLDADHAGLTATHKSALVALTSGMRVKAVRLPSGKDPADAIGEDKEKFKRSVVEALPIVEFFLTVLGERERDQHRLVLAAERIVLPLLAAIASPLEQSHFMHITARALDLTPEAVAKALQQRERRAVVPPGEAVHEKEAASPKRSAREARGEMIAALARAYPDTPLASRIKTEYARITEAPLPETVPDAAVFAVEAHYGESPSPEAADELLTAFEAAFVREAYQAAIADLRRAERSADTERIRVAHQATTILSKRLATLTQ